MKRAIIVQGLAFGDEGKGATVDFLARELAADWVVRYCGGSQAGHNVVLPDGRRHAFSQFGAGTLAGAGTYLGEQMIVNLPALHNEAQHLRVLTGRDPFEKLVVHPRALVSTWYHQQLNRLRELSRGAARHGSCGHGIGETRNYWLQHGSDALFAGDLNADNAQRREIVAGKLELLRQRALIEAQTFVENVPADEQWRMNNLLLPSRQVAAELLALARPIAMQANMPNFKTAIFEGAQGVLLDEWRGFHPYTTWSTVTLQHALDMIERSEVDELCTLGLTRAYTPRHGAGPLPTWSSELDEQLCDPGNPTNDWQGTIRNGWLDLVLLSYATAAAGGPFDGLVINGIDELAEISPQVCESYKCPGETPLDRLPVSRMPSLKAQERLTTILEQAKPVCRTATMTELCSLAEERIAPLSIAGRGPTWQDRTLHGLKFRPRNQHLIAEARLCPI